jgi:hypothetical protein
VATGLSVGYVVYTVRSGVLAYSILTMMPNWRVMDPLPILDDYDRAQRKRTSSGDGSDDESLESLVNGTEEKPLVRVNMR